MHIEFLVEEESTEKFLSIILPKILGTEVTTRIHPHQGKKDLLNKLPDRLRGYARWLPRDWKIVVLMDEDRKECLSQKSELETAALNAGLITKSSVRGNQAFQVLNRLAVEELEAWFFGDVQALVEAYPSVPPTLGQKAAYRDPDGIRGGTWEALELVLQRAGHHRGGLAKVRAAEDIARRMDPSRNRSPSFRVFVDGLRRISGRPARSLSASHHSPP